ncbi:MAG: hypothetical protein O2783_03320 [Chloroflexi bacterium]|nr:hypothetical protein [Chloroflexota bacterium]
MDYEYGFLVETIEVKDEIADATADELRQGFASGLAGLAHKISTMVPTLPRSGFEVVSHDLTKIDRHLILSVLIRRPLG